MLKLQVTSVTMLTPRIASFHLRDQDGDALPTFEPGAHIAVSTPAGMRQYSLITWPDDASNDYQIAVLKEEAGRGGSDAMHRLRTGDVRESEPPKNDFQLMSGSEPVLLLAGGIGITPLISMATQLRQQGRKFQLHYAGHSKTQMAFLERLIEVFGEAVIPHFDDVDPIDLVAVLSGKQSQALYICGPLPMINAAREVAESAGFPPDKIHVELFATPDGEENDQAFEVELASSGEVISVAADQSIIEALEAAGHDVLYDCQRGDCGICQTDVIAGEPDHRDVVLSEDERQSGKVMQICVSRARSDRLVLDL